MAEGKLKTLQATFSRVGGYDSYERAELRGKRVSALFEESSFSNDCSDVVSWVVVALPDGNFAPCFILDEYHGRAIQFFMGVSNVCVIN